MDMGCMNACKCLGIQGTPWLESGLFSAYRWLPESQCHPNKCCCQKFLLFSFFSFSRSAFCIQATLKTTPAKWKKNSLAILHMKTAVRIAKYGCDGSQAVQKVPSQWTYLSPKLLTHEAQYPIAPASKERVHQGRQHMLENLLLLNPTL